MRKSCIEYGDNVKKLISLADSCRPVIFFDLETTGIRPTLDRVISFSAIKYVKQGAVFKEIDRMDMFMNPGFHIPEEASAVNGITDEMVVGCPREFGAFDRIDAFIGKDPVICGYNSVNFDEKFMNGMYMRQTGDPFTPLHHTDVIKMAKEQIECKSYRLVDVAHEMGCDMNISFHRSIDDVIATKRVFDTILPFYLSEEKNAAPGFRVYIKDIRFWGPKHELERYYISTYPFGNTYYDLYRKEWHCDIEGADMDLLISDVLKFANVSTVKELGSKKTREAFS